MSLLVDCLLVTVNSVEAGAVIKVFCTDLNKRSGIVNVGNLAFHDLGTLNSQRIAMVQCEMGSVSLGSSLPAVYEAIDSVRPAMVIMVGVAFGVKPATQKIGDILVASKIALYEPQRVGTVDGSAYRISRGSKVDVSPKLLSHFHACEHYWNKATADVSFGIMLSGEKLIDNVEFRDQLLQEEPEAIGGEMEGAGLYVACQSQKCDWILTKAICDWADGNKATNKKANQELAATNAAKFVLHALTQGGLIVRDFRKVGAAKRYAGKRAGRAAMTLLLDQDRNFLDLEKQHLLISSLAKVGGVVEEDIEIIAIESGSVKVTVETTDVAVKRISENYHQSGTLVEMRVMSVETKELPLLESSVSRDVEKQDDMDLRLAFEDLSKADAPVEPVVSRLLDVLYKSLKNPQTSSNKRAALNDMIRLVEDFRNQGYPPGNGIRMLFDLISRLLE